MAQNNSTRPPVTRRDRREDTPAAYQSGPQSTGPVVVCAGDSITAADISANWISTLRAQFGSRGWRFLNAGVNGNLAWNIRQRLDEIIACKPDAVILLVGSNDVAATLNDKVERDYRKRQHIPHTPNLDWYVENIEAIVSRLRTETRSSIALVEIPPLGEDLDSDINLRVTEYNTALHKIAAREGLPCLPLHERLVALIPPQHAPTAYTHRIWPMLHAGFAHFILRQPWNEISRRNGLILLTDWVHLNDRAGKVLSDLAADFINTCNLSDR